MLSATDVAGILKMHTKTFYGFLKRPTSASFPKPLIVGVRSYRWRKADIERWIATQVEATDPPAS